MEPIITRQTLDELKNMGTPKEPEVPVIIPDPEKPEITPAVPPVEPPVKPVVVPETPPASAPTDPDYKEKFRNSTREVQIAMEREKQLNERLENLTNTEIPTDEELQKLHPQWEYYSDTEKQLIRQNVITERKLNKTSDVVAGFIAEQRWQVDLTKAVASYPELKGREEEFKNFVFKPLHRGVPIETLVGSFLYEIKDELEKPAPPTPPQNKPVLENGGAGGPQIIKTEMSYEERAALRKSDPKKYNELIKRGIIK